MTEPTWIDERDAVTLHARLLALHGGAPGTRDVSLLQSALARPQQLLAYSEDGVSLIELAAAYTFGLVRNHPFVDGNKRTGFIVGILFLELNGYQFVASEDDAAQAVLALASSQWGEADYARFLKDQTQVG